MQMLDNLLARLQEERVIEARQAYGVTEYSLSHEVMVPKVQSWYDPRELERKRALETLGRVLAEYQSSSALLNETQVELIRTWVPMNELSSQAQRLLEASEGNNRKLQREREETAFLKQEAARQAAETARLREEEVRAGWTPGMR
jgi:hypothetical protein